MHKNVIKLIMLVVLVFVGYLLFSRVPESAKEISSPDKENVVVIYSVEGKGGVSYEVRVNDIPIAEDISSRGDLRPFLYAGKNTLSVYVDKGGEDDATLDVVIAERVAIDDAYTQFTAQPQDKVLVSYTWRKAKDTLPVTYSAEFYPSIGKTQFLSDEGKKVELTSVVKMEVLKEATDIQHAFLTKDVDTVQKKMKPMFLELATVFNVSYSSPEANLEEVAQEIREGKLDFAPVSTDPTDFDYQLYGNGKIVHIRKKTGDAFLQTSTVDGQNRGYELYFSNIKGEWVWVR